jgi:hypothetical protein
LAIENQILQKNPNIQTTELLTLSIAPTIHPSHLLEATAGCGKLVISVQCYCV